MKVQNDATSRLLIKSFMPFLLMKYLFHYYFFYRYKKCLPLVEDLDNESKVYALPLFSQSKGFLSRIIIILWAFHNDPYFITLFYRRLSTVTGHWRLLNTIKPDNSDLHLECWSIGRNFQMFHPFSTIINCRSIGDNFSFRNNTTIGNKYDDNSKTPIIGSNVTIGANVVVFGDIRIGNNVTIGAGAVVNKDIPDNSVAYGNPLKIVAKNI